MNDKVPEDIAEKIVVKLGAFQTNGHWQIGKIISETISESETKSRVVDVCRSLAAHPKGDLSYSYLRQCIRTYTYYPDITHRELPEALYHVLANRIYRQEDRDKFEKLAIENKWNANQLASEIRKELRSRKEREKSDLGFDLKLTNRWYFNTSDPRFGKPKFKGRIAGQIVANALYYFAGDEGLVVDIFAGSGTLGDVIDKLSFFSGFTYKMFDLTPSDKRIEFNDATITGIPLPNNSASYIFLDPPYGNIGKNYYGDSDTDLSMMGPELFSASMFSVIRECCRVLLPKKNVSLIIEPTMPFVSKFIDYPSIFSRKFEEEGFEIISKVYVPNQTMRNEGSMPNIIAKSRSKRKLISDCRELITFMKPQG